MFGTWPRSYVWSVSMICSITPPKAPVFEATQTPEVPPASQERGMFIPVIGSSECLAFVAAKHWRCDCSSMPLSKWLTVFQWHDSDSICRGGLVSIDARVLSYNGSWHLKFMNTTQWTKSLIRLFFSISQKKKKWSCCCYCYFYRSKNVRFISVEKCWIEKQATELSLILMMNWSCFRDLWVWSQALFKIRQPPQSIK